MSQPVALEGHSLCATCESRWVLDVVSRWTSGDCPECYVRNGCQRRSRITLLSRGNRLSIPRSPARKRRHRPNKAKSKAAEKAKERARAKLAAMFPELYFELVADERAAMGLDPWTVPMTLRGGGPEAAQAALALAEALEAGRH